MTPHNPPAPNIMFAWHFLAKDGYTRRGDDYPPPVKVEVGQTLTESRPLEMCRVGLHASVRALDALRYGPGPVVCRVRMSGASVTDPEHLDKLCYSERTALAMADASAVLHEFACWCAARALDREREAGREPDPRCWAAIEAKRAWIRGEITNQDLAAARDAAWDAASAARYAAWAAAGAAAWAAARDAAWAAAWAATEVAEVAANAASEADEDIQNRELERRLSDLLGMAKDTPAPGRKTGEA